MKKNPQKGFSLVELMIAMVLGLVIVGGVINIFLSNQQAFRSNENLARLQENGRIAFELMARELRQAGGNPCGTTRVSNVLNDKTTEWSSNWAAGTIRGFDGDEAATGIVATGTGTAQRVSDTDAIVILSGGLDTGVVITDHDPPSAQFKVNLINHGISPGDIVMACDPNSAAITQITNASPGTNDTLVHNNGTGTPGNCSKGLGFPEDCSSVNGNPKTFEDGGFITKLSASTWYVGNNSRGGQSLFKVSTSSTDEIAEGVSDMQIDYLLRTKATGTSLAPPPPDDSWLGASSLTWTRANGTAATPWTDEATKEVVAVRLKLTLETKENVGTEQQAVTRQLIHVVNLRNKGTR